jgi:hypothetical protein
VETGLSPEKTKILTDGFELFGHPASLRYFDFTLPPVRRTQSGTSSYLCVARWLSLLSTSCNGDINANRQGTAAGVATVLPQNCLNSEGDNT